MFFLVALALQSQLNHFVDVRARNLESVIFSLASMLAFGEDEQNEFFYFDRVFSHDKVRHQHRASYRRLVSMIKRKIRLRLFAFQNLIA